MDLSINFPPGAWASTPLEDEDGEGVVWIFPRSDWSFARRASCEAQWLAEIGECEFSTGNAWPDTDGMVAHIEERLCADWPVIFRHQTLGDAVACHGRLLRAGVAGGPFRGLRVVE